VELAVKDMEYKAVDDRKLDAGVWHATVSLKTERILVWAMPEGELWLMPRPGIVIRGREQGGSGRERLDDMG
jgi:hypothetical protein